jgi:hypothetical protein
MSDGYSEARRGTYFMDKSQKYDEKEEIEKRIDRIKSYISDYNFEIWELEDRLSELESPKKIT